MAASASDELIRLYDLSKSFRLKGNTITALENINLSIHEGEIFGIIGMSGAGKSTLVRCINFLERPTAGGVIFDGQDLGTLSPAALRQVRRQMGMIFQQFNLLMQRTALQNVCFPLEIAGISGQEAKKRGLELLEIVGLSERANAYPAQLSGGQKQRVAIARALASDPKVLLCDEATSALDPETTDAILNLLKDLSKRMGLTVIVITHEMRVVEEICSRVAVIADHQIAEVGTVKEVFTQPKTEAARRLVYRVEGDPINFQQTEGTQLRITFEGGDAFEPILAELILETREPVNILHADTRTIDGCIYGQMVIQLPPRSDVYRVSEYLRGQGVAVEEVAAHV
ncbi:methionine ABC transporter ATP-binding protein [Peptococcus simiae]|uniref:Methionine ABC transporter ATP-binding protein n=1 Tax=Peptococcus simiae TaxID=1643805 RepID=A0ABW9H012_9FIRM